MEVKKETSADIVSAIDRKVFYYNIFRNVMCKPAFGKMISFSIKELSSEEIADLREAMIENGIEPGHIDSDAKLECIAMEMTARAVDHK